MVFSVPSGNFGNICAGIIAQQMGLPIAHFIASNNVNDAVVRYLDSGIYKPQTTIPTISNAMDVGAPSNFIRIQRIVNKDRTRLQKILSGYRYTDTETKKALKELYDTHGYIADPHGAVGYLGLQDFIAKQKDPYYGVFLETAHPVKFLDVVRETIKTDIAIPERIKDLIQKEKQSTPIKDYEDLKAFLMDS